MEPTRNSIMDLCRDGVRYFIEAPCYRSSSIFRLPLSRFRSSCVCLLCFALRSKCFCQHANLLPCLSFSNIFVGLARFECRRFVCPNWMIIHTSGTCLADRGRDRTGEAHHPASSDSSRSPSQDFVIYITGCVHFCGLTTWFSLGSHRAAILVWNHE